MTKAGDLKICPECREEFCATKHHKKYCSDYCFRAGRSRRNHANYLKRKSDGPSETQA